MVILDKPYVSKEILCYLEQTQVPVLKNDVSAKFSQEYRLNILDEKTFKNEMSKSSRIYTLSEHSLDWLYQNSTDTKLIRYIDLLKDKVSFRQKLQPLYPNVFFQKISFQQLQEIDIAKFQLPMVLKPAIGFFSVGVYTITALADWENAIYDIKHHIVEWQENYPDSVVGKSDFILESYIAGNEYAIDAYYDETGSAVVLNILKHDFSSIADVSDRLYYTSKKILLQYVKQFEDYLNQVNQFLHIANFPFHAEVRVTDEGIIIPIEFNPMRFCGWSCTDITHFAFGFYTYDYYLNNVRPDWDALLEEKGENLFTIIVLDKPEWFDEKDTFQFDALKKDFQKILCLRQLDYQQKNPFGFLFTETQETNYAELEEIMRSDLSEYIKKGRI